MRIEIVRSEDVPQPLRDDIGKRGSEMDWGNTDGVSEWASGEWRVIVWEGDAWVSTLALLKKPITVGGKPVTVGGIGGVMTLPEWRGHGYASAAMKAAADFIRDEMKAAFGLLICNAHRVHLYQSLGWKVVAEPTSFAQPTGKRQFSDVIHVMTYACTEQPWTDGPVDLCGPPW
jgi:GNAT superfamily N-acetyltransferase